MSIAWLSSSGRHGTADNSGSRSVRTSATLSQISREAAIRGLDEMLDTVPYNKFFWGGDCHFIEESAGSLIFGKDVVAQVLALRVERRLMTEDLAREVSRHIFRDNAIRFFKLRL